MKSINQSAVNLLEQIKAVVTQLSDEDYSMPLEILSLTSIGQHTRHALEFFQCLDVSKTSGFLNYDERSHSIELQVKTNLSIDLISLLQGKIIASSSDRDIVMTANYDLEGESLQTIKTTFYRELAYNIEHAIHHMALIKIGIYQAFPEIVLPEHFGVASSTVRFHQAVQSQS